MTFRIEMREVESGIKEKRHYQRKKEDLTKGDGRLSGKWGHGPTNRKAIRLRSQRVEKNDFCVRKKEGREFSGNNKTEFS